ncbi:uncharacterized protein Z518_06091 [Rhinocladiella mackenziei CBS 650.93]|uniref:Uncharacterized protein n=1 Tax=Rhinocladiella mackenziei CBS 650.93 TaxID=1442369 RepID=A0A0D2IHF4_9EURO|nr:uncharacterized protein Z518_06091 [Rhinocladiella mackenziei CBS 650.93]KIX05219.1 hypothetical protein Z518_06091 [Rhinocladiella mackenziei CBS 650.93]
MGLGNSAITEQGGFGEIDHGLFSLEDAITAEDTNNPNLKFIRAAANGNEDQKQKQKLNVMARNRKMKDAPGFQQKKDTLSKYHETVFPGMRIPVCMRSRNKKNRGFSRGVVDSNKSAPVPIMSVQCPIPGGTVTTVTTDPVQKVSWGPITRVEASQEARDLVKKWIETIEEEGDQEKESNKDNVEVKSGLGNDSQGKPIHQGPANINEDDSATDSPSQAETDPANATARMIKPPPPTPPDTIFHPALSMPTLPTLHRISDANLVEQYRLQRALGSDAFDKETREIKRGLIEAKVARGGKDRLLKNEYTVELASREDAAMADRWASGRVIQMRTRGNTMTSVSGGNLEDMKIRGGETDTRCEVNVKNLGTSVPLSPSIVPIERQSGGQSSTKPKGGQTETQQTEPNSVQRGSSTLDRYKQSRRELESRLEALDLSSHVSKITTYGTVRHQHSEKREAGDHGEKRTIKTWIEITEVYEVPSAQVLKLNDVLAAVEEEDDGDGEGTDSADERTSKKREKKRKTKTKSKSKSRRGSQTKYYDKKRVSKLTSPSSHAEDESSNSESSSATDDAESLAFQDHNETPAESLFRSLSRFGEVTPNKVSQMSGDLRHIIAALRGHGQVKASEE